MNRLPTSLKQLIRYAIVGLAQNGVGYALYLFLTWVGFDPKLVVGVCYPAAMLVSFLGNRKFTFNHQGSVGRATARYLAAHACGYGINLLLLYVCVDRLGYPHQLVQLAAIFIVALFLFVTLKFFVFRTSTAA